MRKLTLKEFGKREMLAVGFVLALIAVYGLNTSFVVIQNQPTTMELDYYTTVINSDGTAYSWTKGQGIPSEFDESILSGIVGLSVVFTAANVEIIAVYLKVEGPTPGEFQFAQAADEPTTWDYSLDTTQLTDGTYTFTFFTIVDTSALHPSGVGEEQIEQMSAFGMDFIDGQGSPQELFGLPIEIVVVIGLVVVLLLFTGSKTRRG